MINWFGPILIGVIYCMAHLALAADISRPLIVSTTCILCYFAGVLTQRFAAVKESRRGGVMGHQIIKQPNGLYAVFSSVVDNFIMYDMTAEDIIDDRVEDYRERTTKQVRDIIISLERGEKPYFHRTKTWDEACEWIVVAHGKAALDKVLKVMDEGDGS